MKNDFEKKIEEDLKNCSDKISDADAAKTERELLLNPDDSELSVSNSESDEAAGSYEDVVKQIRSDTISGKQREGERKIPEFNLANQIMAKQRRMTSSRRKRPGETDKSKVTTTEFKEEVEEKSLNIKHVAACVETNEIIREIVARDIARMLGQAN